jgi:hypothetical protein
MTFSREDLFGLRTGGVLLATLLVLLAAGWLLWPDAFFSAYWFGLMFWTQLSLGCLSLLLIQFLTGGAWGQASAPWLRGGAAGLFLLGPLFVPVFFALPHVFSWTTITAGISSPALMAKRPWLNEGAFVARTIVYLGVFIVLTWRWVRPELKQGEPGIGWSGPALVAVALGLSLASSDWMMSLEPSFYSSIYPFVYFSGAMVSTLAALGAVLAWRDAAPDILHAVGKLLLAAVLFWGYITFSQFIIWTGNLPDEASWYVERANHGWQWLTLFVMLFQFVVPFCLLLSQTLKREARSLLRVAGALFAVHFTELFWLMAPRRGSHIDLNPFDVVLPLLIGACWTWFAGRSADTAAVSTGEAPS